MPASAVALEGEYVTARSGAACEHPGDLRPVHITQPAGADAQVRREMRAVPGADNHPRNLRPLQHIAAGDSRDVDTMAKRDGSQRMQQLLEQRPSTEVVDDQLVLGQRAILERRA